MLRRTSGLSVAVALGLVLSAGLAHSDGTEALGPPSIPIAPGSGFVVAGTGLFEHHGWMDYSNVPGEIVVVGVPAGAVINQVLLYWNSEYFDVPANLAVVNGEDVIGTPIGGPSAYFSGVDASGDWRDVIYQAFRADITDLYLAGGTNVLEVDVVDSSFRNTGAGVLVIYDDGTNADIQVRDGLDIAFNPPTDTPPPPLNVTEPVTFNFPADTEARQAQIALHVGSVGPDRPNITLVHVGGDTLQYNNLFSALDGLEWDSQILEVQIPAGETSLTVEILSADPADPPTGLLPASLAWIVAGLAIAPADVPEPEPCLPCEGQVTQLTLEYQGSLQNAEVRVEYRIGRDRGETIDTFVVNPGDTFTVVGDNHLGTLGPEIEVFVNGVSHADIHTSCSQPIGPGMVFSDFLVIEGYSRRGGLLCPEDGVTQPPASQICEDEKPVAMIMRYVGTGCDASSHDQKDDKCSGDPQGASPVRILATDKKNHDDSKAKVYFDGIVALDETFVVDAHNAGEKKLKSNTHLYVLDLNGNLLQQLVIHTSCSQPLNLGDQFGSVILEDWEPENDLPPADADLCDAGKPEALSMLYVGEGCDASWHQQKKDECEGDPMGASPVHILVTDKKKADDKKARVYFDGVVTVGESIYIDALATGTTRLKSNIYAYVFDLNGNLLQSVNIHASCSQPLNIGDQFGSLVLEDFVSEKSALPVAPAPRLLPPVKAAAQCGMTAAGTGAGRTGDLLLITLLLAGLLWQARRIAPVRQK